MNEADLKLYGTKVEAALALLLPNPLEALVKLGIKGQPGICHSCPVAKYLQREIKLEEGYEFWVRGDSVQILATDLSYSTRICGLPSILVGFIIDVDNLCHPSVCIRMPGEKW